MKRLKPLWIALSVALLLIGLLLSLCETIGLPVSGQEFSPDTFALRTFSYRQSPFSKTIRSDRSLDPVIDPCASLKTLKLIPASNVSPARWNLVSESGQTSLFLSRDFDARFISVYLNWSTEQWNTSHIEAAEVLWPEVAALTREGLYLQIPAIMEFALSQDDIEVETESFTRALYRKLSDAYQQAANVATERRQPEIASTMRDRSNQYAAMAKGELNAESAE